MLTYDQIKVTVRADNVTSIRFSMNEGYDGFSFYAATDKLIHFLQGGRDAPDTLRDVFRVAIRFMERITFCDLARAMESREARPKIEHETYNMDLPICVAAILADRIRQARPGEVNANLEGFIDCNDHETRFELTHSERAHWAGMYGIGKGSVRVEFTNDDVKNKFELKLAAYAGLGSSEKTNESPIQKEARTFERVLSSLKAIAKNTTLSATDVGVLRIGPDWAGFTFSAGGLFGGLIFHESSGEWSVHT
jgi:hypothetical protein